jgi:REP element-mobilizing transposase RayT
MEGASVPRPLRLPTLPFGWYYFVRRAANRRKIIADPSEIRTFQRLLTGTLAKSGAHLHFAHVDEDEVHLALQSGQESLSAALGAFCHKYARAVNRSRNEKGSLFRQHGRVLLVQQEKWFLPLGRYIHWIPYLQSRPSDHAFCCWNTDTVYRNRQSIRCLVTSQTFRRLSRRSRRLRVQNQAYRTFFDQKPSRDDIELIKNGSPGDTRILGDSNFVSEVSRALGLPAPRRVIPWSSAEEDIQRVTLMLIDGFRALCDEHLSANKAREWKRLATLDNVRSKWRAPPLPMIRGLSASYVVPDGIATLRQAEHFFRCRPGTLSAGRRRRYQRRFQELFGRSHEQFFRVRGGSLSPSPNDIAYEGSAHQTA